MFESCDKTCSKIKKPGFYYFNGWPKKTVKRMKKKQKTKNKKQKTEEAVVQRSKFPQISQNLQENTALESLLTELQV